jgi:hypothetical protein
MIWQDKDSASRPEIGYPSGYYGRGWKLPLGKSSTTTILQYISGISARILLDAIATGIRAKPGVGSATITITANGTAGLVVTGEGNASFAISADANIVGWLISVGGSANFTISADGDTLVGTGQPEGNATIDISGTADPSALGWMEGTTNWVTTLTAENIVDALWGAVAANYNDAGTMGQKLNSAAVGGVDYDALGAAVWEASIESGLTAEEIVRIMLAALAGKRTGLGTTAEKYMAQDGTTPRITLNNFDKDGNGTPVIDGDL